MIDSLSFKTRARTVDHLGREQIADCPTAISELWKNSFDAYAREVALHIYDGDIPIAALVDDGHGMSRQEFEEKWLVIGTESKVGGVKIPLEDRNGLSYRPRQGQKGIGRLSSAAIGSLLLIVSKRKKSPFVAALVDWRLFENPYLYLQDIEIPVFEFDNRHLLFEELPDMFDRLMSNIWGDSNKKDRDERIGFAWEKFDELEQKENRLSTREAMEKVIIDTTFDSRFFKQWPVWMEKAKSGTAMLIGDIAYDIEAQISSKVSTEDSSTAGQAKERLFGTLSNFTDPYVDKDEKEKGRAAEDFSYSVTVWEGDKPRPIISNDFGFDLKNLVDLEHVVDGKVDNSGIFSGRIRAFGKWLDGSVTIIPKAGVPTHPKSKVGPFHLRIGSYERELQSTTHTPEVHSQLREQSERYGGFMIYRNGLRVMPFGREDNDFFEVEQRRARHAGREFWTNRGTFGRVAISRELNPNLKDKAGREGIIDNHAAKTFRDIVVNILKTTSRRYFGTDSDIRKNELPEIRKNHEKQKAEEARKQIKVRKRREFKKNLKKFSPTLDDILSQLQTLSVESDVDKLPNTEQGLQDFRNKLSDLNDRYQSVTLGSPPGKLGVLEESYHRYQKERKKAKEMLTQLNETSAYAMENIKPKEPREVAYSEIRRNAAFIHKRLREWHLEAKGILNKELSRIAVIVDERNKEYDAETLPLLEDLEHKRISLSKMLNILAKARNKQDNENAGLFEPYISTLKSLRDSIDIETLVTFTLKESTELQQEVNRLHSLAQLGITVEIIGHEIEGLENTISQGLKDFPENVKQTSIFSSIKAAHEALNDRLRFLSPLKLSGEKHKTLISGENILGYIFNFFNKKIEKDGIHLVATPEFRRFCINEQVSRIYPVFINLINNSRYWVRLSRKERKNILLDVVENKVVVADDGPGVEEDDLKHLFSLFFTRKIRGGRGVGLYLCRANLAAGGHTIQYATEKKFKLLPGANFIIDFKGAKYE